jgi:hypothetical protein
MYSPKRRFRLYRHPGWAGGVPTPPTGSSADILTFSRSLATTFTGYDVTPTDGGALTLNSQSVGNYEVTARKGNTTISSFTASDWFTNTKDTTSSWIIVNGNLTINPNQVIIPPVRKLFTVVYVTGNLFIDSNGGISMTARGANHSGTGDSGGATSAVDIRIATGTFSTVVNPQIPSTGGGGATGTTTDNAIVSGTAGSAGGTGGGGAGGKFLGTGRSGNGSTGTCFSGGSGGGGQIQQNTAAGDAEGNGGKGGDAIGGASGGGSGNPGGASGGTNGATGNSGTGGTLVVIVEGTLSGTGTIVAGGVAGIRPGGSVAGGASGGGSVTVLYKTDSSSITPAATGGSGNFSGNGGNGTARKLAIP